MSQNSYVEISNHYNDFKPVVVWSDELKKLLASYWFNGNRTTLESILARLFIELSEENENLKNRLNGLENRLSQLEKL